MSKLYRYEGQCENYHNWISSPTSSLKSPLDRCPICNSTLETFQRNEIVESLNFVIEPARYYDMKGHVVQEKRFYLAIQDQTSATLARSCHSFVWIDAVKELEKLHGRSGDRLFRALKNKNWCVYI